MAKSKQQPTRIHIIEASNESGLTTSQIRTIDQAKTID